MSGRDLIRERVRQWAEAAPALEATEPPERRFHRALKGPGVLNAITPRAELPAFDDVYPVAAEALRRFELGATTYSASLNGWTLHARPVAAARQSCVECHNSGPAHVDGAAKVQPGTIPGGVIYLFRR